MSRFLLGVAIGLGLGYAVHLLFQPVGFANGKRQRRPDNADSRAAVSRAA